MYESDLNENINLQGEENPGGIPLVPMKFLVIGIGYTQKSG